MGCGSLLNCVNHSDSTADHFGIHVEVGYNAYLRGCNGVPQHAFFFHESNKRICRKPAFNVKDDDVGFNGQDTGHKVFFRQRFRKLLCMFVILSKTLHVVLQRVNTRSSKIPGLAHAAAECFAHPLRFANEFAAPDHKASDRATKTLAKSDGYAVKDLTVLEGCFPLCNHCVEKAGAVEVKPQVVFVANGANATDFFKLVATSPAAVRRIFQ